ncbi:uncharacterized protein BJ171DRAFT_509937, partial [Polychytrium aggregatum]|uniref:uncharacterized protein n=1 Tax=Polychytrium aggregatum TaxID=110093 RepID=UPI0022FE4056
MQSLDHLAFAASALVSCIWAALLGLMLLAWANGSTPDRSRIEVCGLGWIGWVSSTSNCGVLCSRCEVFADASRRVL